MDGRELVGVGAEERDETGVALVVFGGPDGRRDETGQEQELRASIHGKLPPCQGLLRLRCCSDTEPAYPPRCPGLPKPSSRAATKGSRKRGEVMNKIFLAVLA